MTFPLMKKSDVNGDATNELVLLAWGRNDGADSESRVFKYLKSQKAGILGLERIKWNFEKFLVDQKGQVVHRYASVTKPESSTSCSHPRPSTHSLTLSP